MCDPTGHLRPFLQRWTVADVMSPRAAAAGGIGPRRWWPNDLSPRERSPPEFPCVAVRGGISSRPRGEQQQAVLAVDLAVWAPWVQWSDGSQELVVTTPWTRKDLIDAASQHDVTAHQYGQHIRGHRPRRTTRHGHRWSRTAAQQLQSKLRIYPRSKSPCATIGQPCSLEPGEPLTPIDELPQSPCPASLRRGHHCHLRSSSTAWACFSR